MDDQEPIFTGKVHEKVAEVEHQLFMAIKEKDSETVSELLTHTFTYHNPDSGNMTREEFIAGISGLTVPIESIGSDNLSIKLVNDNLALVTGIQKSTVIIDNQRQTFSVAFTDLFVRKNGKWLLDYANGIDLP